MIRPRSSSSAGSSTAWCLPSWATSTVRGCSRRIPRCRSAGRSGPSSSSASSTCSRSRSSVWPQVSGASGVDFRPEVQLVFGIGLVVLIILSIGLYSVRNFGRRLLVRAPLPRKEQVLELYERFEEGVFALKPRQIPVIATVTGLIWATEAMRLYFVIAALGFTEVHLGISGAFFVALAASLLTAIPFTPAGLGIVELGVLGILTVIYGIDQTDAAAIILVDRAISVFSIWIFGSIAYVLSDKTKAGRRPAVEASATRRLNHRESAMPTFRPASCALWRGARSVSVGHPAGHCHARIGPVRRPRPCRSAGQPRGAASAARGSTPSPGEPAARTADRPIAARTRRAPLGGWSTRRRRRSSAASRFRHAARAGRGPAWWPCRAKVCGRLGPVARSSNDRRPTAAPAGVATSSSP